MDGQGDSAGPAHRPAFRRPAVTAPHTAPETAPETAMLLAAGLGTRMRPLTGAAPKPLLEVGGRTMLDRTLDKALEAGVTRAVVNTHHLAAQIERRLEARAAPEIVISHEAEILDTGGGVLNALDALGPDPFFVLNSDTVWEDGPTPALHRLAEAWDPARMDALLLVHPTVAATGYAGDGDFFMDIEGRLQRRGEAEIAPFVFTGSQILSPALFDGMAPGAFSLNRVYNRALERERLYGIRHDGAWHHVGTPDSFERVSRLYAHIAPHIAQG
ncbi:MAG: nucleotidyltransferase family protein, partial [Rhodospirillaceae bacterium]|nr:nucleotidyltransferase family protein [Rhodospirillaceae bacterium]